jgi:putative Ca2+/H+ antiporter (TMEM165/GDT1 family)
MDFKGLVTVFGIVFLAEIGDKTQLATMLFAAKSPANLIAVFIGASAALVLASAIGVVAGSIISHYVSPRYLSYVAGIGFLIIGAWTLWQGSNLS